MVRVLDDIFSSFNLELVNESYRYKAKELVNKIFINRKDDNIILYGLFKENKVTKNKRVYTTFIPVKVIQIIYEPKSKEYIDYDIDADSINMKEYKGF